MTEAPRQPLRAFRYLEFSEGSSNKFWRIELDGSSHTVTFGRIGTAGQTQTKDFGSAQAARKAYDKVLAEKTKKGYYDAPGPKTASSRDLSEKKTSSSNSSKLKGARTKLSPLGEISSVERMKAAVQALDLDNVFPGFSGPVPEKSIAAVEKKLGLPIQGSYREFIRLLGSQNDFGFCGVNSQYPDSGMSGMTQWLRANSGLPEHYLCVWSEEGGDEVYLMDCSSATADGEFLVYPGFTGDLSSIPTDGGMPFVEFFEGYFNLEPSGKATVKKKSRAELQDEKRRAQALEKSRKFLARSKSERGRDERPPLIRRMDSALAAYFDTAYATPSGPVPDAVIDRVAKKLGVLITGSYRRFIQVAGTLKGDMRGINLTAPDADVVRVTNIMRKKYRLPKHYLVVLMDELADEEMQEVFLIDSSHAREDADCQTYRAFVDDWKGTLTRDKTSFVDMFVDYHGEIERIGNDIVVAGSRSPAPPATRFTASQKSKGGKKKKILSRKKSQAKSARSRSGR